MTPVNSVGMRRLLRGLWLCVPPLGALYLFLAKLEDYRGMVQASVFLVCSALGLALTQWVSARWPLRRVPREDGARHRGRAGRLARRLLTALAICAWAAFAVAVATAQSLYVEGVTLIVAIWLSATYIADGLCENRERP